MIFKIYLYVIIIGLCLTGLTTLLTPADNYIKIYSKFANMSGYEASSEFIK